MGHAPEERCLMKIREALLIPALVCALAWALSQLTGCNEIHCFGGQITEDDCLGVRPGGRLGAP